MGVIKVNIHIFTGLEAAEVCLPRPCDPPPPSATPTLVCRSPHSPWVGTSARKGVTTI